MRPAAWLIIGFLAVCLRAGAEVRVSASSARPGSPARAAFDRDRFSTNALWHGGEESTWTWQADFDQMRQVASILQVNGDHDFVLRNAPADYAWLYNRDGQWIQFAAITNENRLFREIRLKRAVHARSFRLVISKANGEAPAVREVEFSANAQHKFPDWFVVLNITHDATLPGEGRQFIPLARGSNTNFFPAQQVWLDSFNREFLAVEPRPLCAFISGSFKDWCEVDRKAFRGLAEVLGEKKLPIWASCGGAQALAIIAEHGIDAEWDCPHCRDPKKPKSPIYGHIGHTATTPCGDYSACVFERGPHNVRVVEDDVAFVRMPREFKVMQSHCGQIEFMPKGWTWLVGPGQGTLTRHQAFRLNDAPIYAAQFHIEMEGAPESSASIMKNFLEIARGWGGYRK